MEENYFTTDHPMVGRQVQYNGDNRLNDLGGLVGKVASVKVYLNGDATYAVKYAGSDKLQYAADWAWTIVDNLPETVEASIGDGIMERIDAELAKLRGRIAELEATKKVLKTL
jgi:hypothetical protein